MDKLLAPGAEERKYREEPRRRKQTKIREVLVVLSAGSAAS